MTQDNHYAGGTAAIIFYRLFDKRFFIDRRAVTKERWPDHYALIGGRIEPDENPEQTIRRELQEELGYILGEVLFLYSQPTPGGVKHVFVAEFDASQTLTLDTAETQGPEWLSLDEWLAQDKKLPHDEEPLRKAVEYVNSLA